MNASTYERNLLVLTWLHILKIHNFEKQYLKQHFLLALIHVCIHNHE